MLAALGLLWWQRQSVGAAELAAHLPTNEGIYVVMDGAVVRQIAGKAGIEEADYLDFVQKTGFDYRKDLVRMVAVIGEPDGHYVIEGRFDWKKISAYAGSCVKAVCSMPASQPGKWISLMMLQPNVLAIAVSPKQLAVGEMEARRKPLVDVVEVPFLVKGKAKYFSRLGLSGDSMVEASLKGDSLEIKAGSVTHNLPLGKLFE